MLISRICVAYLFFGTIIIGGLLYKIVGECARLAGNVTDMAKSWKYERYEKLCGLLMANEEKFQTNSSKSRLPKNMKTIRKFANVHYNRTEMSTKNNTLKVSQLVVSGSFLKKKCPEGQTWIFKKCKPVTKTGNSTENNATMEDKSPITEKSILC